jgi:biopolymer transport protein TolQ
LDTFGGQKPPQIGTDDPSMNPDVVQTALAGPGGFSLFALFWQAHIVVKLVILGLLSASVWCWAIIVEKQLLYARARRQMDQFENVFWSGQSLEQLYQQVSARNAQGLAALFVSAMREWKRTYESGVRSLHGLGGRIDRVMDVTLAREVDRLERQLLVLATVGSSAPFIGLFGTVWGIMSSFQAIAAAKNTNLSVVAPGIAEALLATAIGLFAAIPAVIIYNQFARSIARYRALVGDASAEVLGLVSRDLDRGQAYTRLARAAE